MADNDDKLPDDKQSDQYDSPWKDALDRYFKAFMALLFPDAHADIDWSHPPLFHDKELSKVVRDARVGKGTVDKVAKVRRLSGEEAWVIVHVDVQAQRDSGFERRMYSYHYRLFDRYGLPVVTLVVLADDQPRWRPESYSHELWGCRSGLWFRAVKLLDYEARWEELDRSENPFATVIMAHLRTQATKHDPKERMRWKHALVRRLYKQGYSRDDILELYRLIDWMMVLPPELQEQLEDTVAEHEEKHKMPFITNIERRGIEKGKTEGLREGNRVRAREDIVRALEVRFGAVPERLVEAISTVNDLDLLDELHRQAILSTDLGAFEAVLRQHAIT
jgi:hypothetical protein